MDSLLGLLAPIFPPFSPENNHNYYTVKSKQEEMESSKRRTPLSECTNTIRNSTKTLLLKPSKFLPPTIPHTNPNISLISKSNTSVGSNNHINTSEDDDVSPSAMHSVPCPPFRLTTTSGLGDSRTVYTRRRDAEDKRKEKGKMVVVPMSCPPVERNLNFREIVNRGDIVGLSMSCAVTRKKKPRRSPSAKEESVLLKDYIDQQRAYFAEIDAFELEEEVASESELD